MLIRSLIILIALWTGLAQAASPEPANNTPTPTRSALLKWLNGFEWQLSQRQAQLATVDVNDLIAVINDSSLSNAYRYRALAALQLHPTEATAEFLANLISTSNERGLLIRAITVATDTFAQSRPEWLAPLCEYLLTSPHAHVRIPAAQALQIHQPDNPALRAYMQSDIASWERSRARQTN